MAFKKKCVKVAGVAASLYVGGVSAATKKKSGSTHVWSGSEMASPASALQVISHQTNGMSRRSSWNAEQCQPAGHKCNTPDEEVDEKMTGTWKLFREGGDLLSEGSQFTDWYTLQALCRTQGSSGKEDCNQMQTKDVGAVTNAVLCKVCD
ncbi:unnamed protein product [Amoebophrya sp. A120]|nr:unnamed protein product [Amoebophrya sp. A120]|eukprot:GSA120T00008822001.1